VSSLAQPSPGPTESPDGAASRAERGWGRLAAGLMAFLLVPATLPELRALLPIAHTMTLLVPAMAACALVGWWAGGRPLLAAIWVALAVLIAIQDPPRPNGFYNLARGWSLLLAGAFGLVCLFGARRAFFPRALTALSIALGLALGMVAVGPMTGSQMKEAVSAELTRRNAETVQVFRKWISEHPSEWQSIASRIPLASGFPAAAEQHLGVVSRGGVRVFPALLALESLAALALAWGAYHRLSRTRLGAPLGRLKEFRFNDQLVWGLIVGLTAVFLPTLAAFRAAGSNLLVFFGALYALRGLGVVAWFVTTGAVVTALLVGLAMLLVPILGPVAVLGIMILLVAAVALGLGDTWADWRRPRRTT
jgi:hypothetical protein